MDWNPDPRILAALENAVAASRWRVAARFEGAETAAQFRRQGEIRRSAATDCLNDVAKAGRNIPASPRLASRETGGRKIRRTQS